jgi:hypothetical protein
MSNHYEEAYFNLVYQEARDRKLSHDEAEKAAVDAIARRRATLAAPVVTPPAESAAPAPKGKK